jgi:hypothetical protein
MIAHAEAASAVESLRTAGSWATEAEAGAALDAVLAEHTHLWTVYREVPGTPIHLRPGQDRNGLRIDRILCPRPALVELGWTAGIVGIEIKRSGEKAGPPLSQCMDYLRASWRLPPSGSHIMLDFVFLWPLGKVAGTLASIMAQQRIGSAFTTGGNSLRLVSGEANILTVRRSGEAHVGACTAGTRIGSR